jgi:hypothetical protein
MDLIAYTRFLTTATRADMLALERHLTACLSNVTDTTDMLEGMAYLSHLRNRIRLT